MPAELDALIDNLDTAFQSIYLNFFQQFNIGFQNLGNAILANNWTAAHDYCDSLGSLFWVQWRNTWTLSSSNFRYYMLQVLRWIDTNWTTGGATMDDILNAMLGANFDQLQKFIGIEDAYRVALWNAPFNADFYAALARGFQKWPTG